MLAYKWFCIEWLVDRNLISTNSKGRRVSVYLIGLSSQKEVIDMVLDVQVSSP